MSRLQDFVQTSYNDGADAPRYERLVAEYHKLFGRYPTHAARAPGRVNLIGEHTDYNGLPVMPMALRQDIAAVFAPRDDQQIVLCSTHDGSQQTRFTLEPSIPASPRGDWDNYAKAAAQGLVNLFDADALSGMDILYDGTIPAGMGLSSSSALVVCTAVALLVVSEMTLPGHDLASLLAVAERYVGTQGGGMDQAASVLSIAGHALKIDFFPLRAEPIPIPNATEIVVASSTVFAGKTEGAMQAYNARSAACRMALDIIKRALGVDDPNIARIGDLYPLGYDTWQLLSRVKPILPDRILPLNEIAALLGITIAQVEERYLQSRIGIITEGPHVGFSLWRRFRHVVTEGNRVNEAANAFKTGKLERVGILMNESHLSCRDDYAISCPEIEELVDLARESGALGSRLTGAGFGGCTVHLVGRAGVESLMDALWEGFYRYRNADRGKVMFVAVPSPGAGFAALD